MLNNTKPKRKIEIIILGWVTIFFAAYLFYRSLIILGEYAELPFPLVEILAKGPLDFKIRFFNAVISHIFSILLFISGVKILYLKRWAFILLISVLILDFIQKFYIIITLAGRPNILFAVEIVLLILAFYCLKRSLNKKTIK
ncbi:MAG: hypothetical protein PHG69_05880 [Candidatus Omnitrophica bacterium]|nr:hypothetical protein [Candidatus Omnitrophota bacterium]